MKTRRDFGDISTFPGVDNRGGIGVGRFGHGKGGVAVMEMWWIRYSKKCQEGEGRKKTSSTYQIPHHPIIQPAVNMAWNGGGRREDIQ